jgi:hypothetical protein
MVAWPRTLRKQDQLEQLDGDYDDIAVMKALERYWRDADN